MCALENIGKILVIRRDNIGDLLLTTPLLTALKKRYPHARLAVLANVYNAPVLVDNPDIDQVFQYAKAKHSPDPKLVAWWKEFSIFRALRREAFDLVIHGNPMAHPRTEKLVRFIGGRIRLGVADGPTVYTHQIPSVQVTGTHHAERVFSLLKPLGIEGAPGPLTLKGPGQSDGSIGIQLSSRRPDNQWPLAHYETLIDSLDATRKINLFWAPGPKDDPHHPGDDDMAEALHKRFGDRVTLNRTKTLPDLIAAMNKTALMVTPDGGALHIAAALGKPIIALFGCTDPNMWGPWGVANRVLNGQGRAANVTPEAVLTAIQELAP